MNDMLKNMTLDFRKDQINIYYSFKNKKQQDSIIIFTIDISELPKKSIAPILEPNQFFYEYVKYTKALDIYGDNDNDNDNDNDINFDFESYYTRGDGHLIFECYNIIPSDPFPLNCQIEFKVIEECYQEVSGRYSLNTFHTCITDYDLFLHGFYYYNVNWMPTIEIPKDICQLIETFSQVAFLPTRLYWS